MTDYSLRSILQGIDTALGGILSSLGGKAAASAVIPGGRLYVPPAYLGTYDVNFTQSVQPTLGNTNCSIGMGFTPEIDFALDSFSIYIATQASSPQFVAEIVTETTATEPEGCFNKNAVDLIPTMTANDAPSPYVVGVWDSAGNNVEGGATQAFKAFDNASGTYVRTTAAPTGVAPQHVTVDFGSGTGKAVNKIRWTSAGDSVPKAVTVWGSNVASPVKHTDADWTSIPSTWDASLSCSAADMAGGNSWTVKLSNGTIYRHYRISITDRWGGNAYFQLREIEFFESDTTICPSASAVHTLGTFTVSGTGMQRFTFTAKQLYRGVKYWLKLTAVGTQTLTFRVTCADLPQGKLLPYGVDFRYTTNAGAAWSRFHPNITSFGHMVDTGLELVLNSTTNHSPQLHYGRCDGNANIALYESSAWVNHAIPIEGIKLNCDALTAGTYQEAYVYDNGGTLTLEASTTAPTTQDGVKVKAGATTRRRVGVFSPVEWQTGYQGPIRCPDKMLVWNEDHRTRLNIWRGGGQYRRANCQYLFSATGGNTTTTFNPVHATDTLLSFIVGDNSPLQFEWGFYSSSAYFLSAILIDDNGEGITRPGQQVTYAGTVQLCVVSTMVGPGVHTVNLGVSVLTGGAYVYLGNSTYTGLGRGVIEA